MLASLLSAGAAHAGNIFLTGHDTDFHMYNGSASANAAMVSDLAFVRHGSTLPVLTVDAGTQLTSDMTTLGVGYVNVNPGGTLTASMFNPALYSAILVASDSNCGGCDNTNADLANLATMSAAIASFVNAGGGLAGFAGATDTTAYAYVPTAASNGGGNPPSSGFVETAAGTALGLVAENGDPTHNYFGTPGVGGLSSTYTVVETNSGNNESLAVAGAAISCGTTGTCTITGTGSVPEPGSMLLVGSGLIGLVGLRRRRDRGRVMTAA